MDSIQLYASIGFIAAGTLYLKFAPDRESVWGWVELFGRSNREAAKRRKEVWRAGL